MGEVGAVEKEAVAGENGVNLALLFGINTLLAARRNDRVLKAERMVKVVLKT